MNKVIYVYLDLGNPLFIAKLYCDAINGKEIYSIELSDEYLKSNFSHIRLDPEIENYPGRQYLSSDKKIFGFISDSCPDRWGRNLLNRKEKENASMEHRVPRKLNESDYLLGVYDKSRMGALRYKLDLNSDFLANDIKESIPPWIYLRTLEQSAINFDFDESIDNDWINNLLVPASSLGGARAKASVYDNGGNLWIGKFPSRKDDYDIGAWEYVANELAKLCSLDVPDFKLEKFSKYGSTFLTKRFDRNDDKRLHMISMMTCLKAKDGDNDNYSYIDIADFIKANSIEPKSDLIELWKRLIFNMAINNNDDHLRNHAMILDEKGLRLSPIYDINPSPYGNRLSINITMDDNLIDTDNLFKTYQYYNLNKLEALRYYNEIVTIINSNWKEIATRIGISNNSIELMKSAFKLKNI